MGRVRVGAVTSCDGERACCGWGPGSGPQGQHELHATAAATRGLHPGNVLGPGPLASGHSVILSHGRFEQRLCTVPGNLDFFHKSWKCSMRKPCALVYFFILSLSHEALPL